MKLNQTLLKRLAKHSKHEYKMVLDIKNNIIIEEGQIDTTLAVISSGVSLIKIPPPIDESDQSNISNWNFNEKVWIGKMRIFERELISNEEDSFQGKEQISGLIQLENITGGIFASIVYDASGESVQITTSKKAYRILIQYEEKKIALGLVLADSELAQVFSMSIQTIKKHIEEAIEAQKEFAGDVSQDTSDMDLRGHFNAGVKSSVLAIAVDDSHDDDDDDDDDFGDFVAG